MKGCNDKMKKRLKLVGIIFVVLIIIGVSYFANMMEVQRQEEVEREAARKAQQNETKHESHFGEMMKAAQRFEEESKKRKKPKPEIFNERLYYLE